MISKNSLKELDKIVVLGHADFYTKSTAIYYFLQQSTLSTCQWYWTHSARKRLASFIMLIIIFVLIISATFTQFCLLNKTTNSAEVKVFYSQLAIGLYMLAAILFTADKVFGWTSGWVRYISAVMSIEACYQRFLLEWMSVNLEDNKINGEQLKQRISLASTFITEVLEIQKQEMTEWATEFGDGLSQLRAMVNERSKAEEARKPRQSSKQPSLQNPKNGVNNEH